MIAAGLDWRQIAILRAYRKYRQRIGSRFTESYQNDVLVANSALTAKLVRYFELRFDPEHERDEAAEKALRDEILADLDEVESLDHDRILRNQLGADRGDAAHQRLPARARRDELQAALRRRAGDAPSPRRCSRSTSTRPTWRGSTCAAGGSRAAASAGRTGMDYRTEVYGLMRAQLTKNAADRAGGAKGGFYLKHRPADPSELREEVQRQYVAYVRALLDVTDNLVDGEVVHPPDTRVRDEDDTYLVVAADKGTATFSDTANAVSEDYGFWLDDAFASGGSAGYDHKKLGITARGAWESVKRHFLELELDVAKDPFTVVGIGDMSGDVFGNGMLLSDRIRLVAAYDHRHIFIDPDPDPDAGFAERKRLFDLAGSSWNDYDRAQDLGGRRRLAAHRQVDPAVGVGAARRWGSRTTSLAPNDLIRAILRAPVDLLWNGGIGTVVKACDGDRRRRPRTARRDAIRVDASELRCRVVGEGGNLGLTRRARVEFARGGGRINADFIDNSAGVDCSDHEVNLKILLGLAERRGELTRARTATSCCATVDRGRRRARALRLVPAGADHRPGGRGARAARLFAYEDLMAGLEEDGLLDRASEALPTGEELAERRRAGRGMERPELALLLTYAKRRVKLSLLESSLLDDPWLERDLRGYFPQPVVERFGHLLGAAPAAARAARHDQRQPRRQRAGADVRLPDRGRARRRPAEVVRAYRIAREVIGAEARLGGDRGARGQGRAARSRSS